MYRGRLERDLDRWVGQGLIDGDTSRRMLAEFDSRESAFSLGRVLMMIAALLIAGAVLLLIAANWDAIPRLARLIGIVALLWIAYFGAAWLDRRGAPRLSAAFLVFGTLGFGGAIALVGQMYHLSGDAMQAALVWLAGAVLVAAVFRSAAVTAVAGFLTFWVAAADWSFSSGTTDDRILIWLMPLMAAVVIGLVRYTGADRARHLAYLLLVAWCVFLYAEFEGLGTAAALAVAGAIAYLLAAVPASPFHGVARNAGAAPAFYSYLVLLVGLGLLHVETEGLTNDALLGVATLAAAIGGIALSGRDNGAVRYLGYVAFAAETLYLASETLGSIIGTAGFFLISGLVVALIAWAVIRLEKRFSRTTVKEA
jgi:uncharacterized membrane protein